MSYSRRVRHPSEIVKAGDVVEVMVLDIKPQQKRIALGLKQAMGDPWERVVESHPVGSPVTGTVRKIMSFGAFVEVVEGVDGLLHISDITSERRLNSPAEVLREGDKVRVKILEVDTKKRRLKVGMKQLEPTETETFLAQVEVGETISGRVLETQGNEAIVEIGAGVRGVCSMEDPKAHAKKDTPLGQTSDLSSLKTMLESAWKGDGGRGRSGHQRAVDSRLRAFVPDHQAGSGERRDRTGESLIPPAPVGGAHQFDFSPSSKPRPARPGARPGDRYARPGPRGLPPDGPDRATPGKWRVDQSERARLVQPCYSRAPTLAGPGVDSTLAECGDRLGESAAGPEAGPARPTRRARPCRPCP